MTAPLRSCSTSRAIARSMSIVETRHQGASGDLSRPNSTHQCDRTLMRSERRLNASSSAVMSISQILFLQSSRWDHTYWLELTPARPNSRSLPMLCRPAVDLKHTSNRVCVCSVEMAKFHDVLSYYEWVERLLPSDHVRKSGRDYLRAIARVKYKGYPFQS